MATKLADILNRHPLMVLTVLLLAAATVWTVHLRSGKAAVMTPSVPVGGHWTMSEEQGPCHQGAWSMDIGDGSIEVKDPHDIRRRSPCIIDAPPNQRALVICRNDVGFGTGIRTMAFTTRPDGSVQLTLAKDDMSPGCSHLVRKQ